MTSVYILDFGIHLALQVAVGECTPVTLGPVPHYAIGRAHAVIVQ